MQSRLVEIPLNKLAPSAANVRKTNRMSGVEELAANIAARGGRLIQSLSVRPVLDGAGEETGFYRVPAGGRRLAALKLLAKRKVIAKTALIPCLVTDDDEEELSLSENIMQEPLHPADQFDAFKLLADRGQGAEEIGARYGVTAQVVCQRLRLASVSPGLVQVYRDGGLTLDQMMAFTVTDDHARQEQVHTLLATNRQPYLIRRMLTEAQVPASDRRAVFVGADAYTAEGGAITRDLFTEDGGGWFSDPALLDRLVVEKLQALGAELKEHDGWKWVEACIDYPHAPGLRRVYPRPVALSDEDQARLDEANVAYESLAAPHADSDDVPEEVRDELDRLSAEIDDLSAHGLAYAKEDVAKAGAFVILGHDGAPRIESGFIRPEDDEPEQPGQIDVSPDAGELTGTPPAGEMNGHEEATAKPLSEALLRDLAAHRTMALRFALGEQPQAALVAVIHALALRTFYPTTTGTCLDLTPRSVGLSGHAAGIDDTAAGRGVAERHGAWAMRIPEAAEALWDFVAGLEPEERLALLAHCASLTVLAVPEPWDRSGRRALAADHLAKAACLDMSRFWKPTAASYFGRVTKAQVIEAVREAGFNDDARRIEGLAKPAMAEVAERLMAESAWLPAPLRPAVGAADGDAMSA